MSTNRPPGGADYDEEAHGAGVDRRAAFPTTVSVPLVRTDFSDDAVWASVRDRVVAPRHVGDGDTFSADVEPIDDPVFADLGPSDLLGLVPAHAAWAILIVADTITVLQPEHHVLVIDLVGGDEDDEDVRMFRATPEAVQEIENNLSLANMDWDEFVDAADADGVVRQMLSTLDDASADDAP